MIKIEKNIIDFKKCCNCGSNVPPLNLFKAGKNFKIKDDKIEIKENDWICGQCLIGSFADKRDRINKLAQMRNFVDPQKLVFKK